jgi:hypothetical protein
MKAQTVEVYNEKPWRAYVFRRNVLVISIKNKFDFHLLRSGD